jgi:hypothetical protein
LVSGSPKAFIKQFLVGHHSVGRVLKNKKGFFYKNKRHLTLGSLEVGVPRRVCREVVEDLFQVPQGRLEQPLVVEVAGE